MNCINCQTRKEIGIKVCKMLSNFSEIWGMQLTMLMGMLNGFYLFGGLKNPLQMTKLLTEFKAMTKIDNAIEVLQSTCKINAPQVL